MACRFFKKFAKAFPVLGALLVFADLGFSDAALPEPGSPGDTLSREDRRMAYLVYNLLDSNGHLSHTDTVRGERLFLRNCGPCHGDDGRRMNLSHDMWHPRYIGTTAYGELPTFWFMMNFGDEERGMLAYYDEIPLDEMIDIAGFAQTLPQKPWSHEEAVEASREDSILAERRKKANRQE